MSVSAQRLYSLSYRAAQLALGRPQPGVSSPGSARTHKRGQVQARCVMGWAQRLYTLLLSRHWSGAEACFACCCAALCAAAPRRRSWVLGGWATAAGVQLRLLTGNVKTISTSFRKVL